MRYSYPAIIDKNGDLFDITFPDIQGAFTCCTCEDEILRHAKEVLKLHIISKTDKLAPSELEDLQEKYPNSKIIQVEVFIDE